MSETLYALFIFVFALAIVGVLFLITFSRERNIPEIQPITMEAGKYYLTLEVIKQPIPPFNWDPFIKWYHAQFTLPVDKDFYYKAYVGENIVNQLSTGPKFFKEANCVWQVKVLEKYYREK